MNTRKCKNKACGERFEITAHKPFAIACCIKCEIILAALYIEKLVALRLVARKRAAAKDHKETKRNEKKIIYIPA